MRQNGLTKRKIIFSLHSKWLLISLLPPIYLLHTPCPTALPVRSPQPSPSCRGHQAVVKGWGRSLPAAPRGPAGPRAALWPQQLPGPFPTPPSAALLCPHLQPPAAGTVPTGCSGGPWLCGELARSPSSPMAQGSGVAGGANAPEAVSGCCRGSVPHSHPGSSCCGC